jgi:fructokinase
MKREVKHFGGIDAGGTTFKCMVVSSAHKIIAEQAFRTATPEQTLSECIQFFKGLQSSGTPVQSLGIASFGPLNVDPQSPDYGLILPGPKSGWSGTNLKHSFEQTLEIPVVIDTDVNGALLAEMAWGNAKGCAAAAYMTVGTGIGAGLMCNGQLIGKPSHPEFGHIRVERHPYDQSFEGVCPFHGDCLEGLASGPSIWARYGDPQSLPEDHVIWDILARYLAQACITLSLTLRADVIVLGGGLMQSESLILKIRKQYLTQINQYLGQNKADIDRLIVPPGLGHKAGSWGGIWLAQSMF